MDRGIQIPGSFPAPQRDQRNQRTTQYTEIAPNNGSNANTVSYQPMVYTEIQQPHPRPYNDYQVTVPNDYEHRSTMPAAPPQMARNSTSSENRLNMSAAFPQVARSGTLSNGFRIEPNSINDIEEYYPPHGHNLFRYTTKKAIELTPEGNFMVNVPVATKLLDLAPSNSFEFSHLSYTAVVGDPDEFVERGYSLRQKYLEKKTEIMIVVTMYNESEKQFLKTWRSLKRNIEYMCRKKKSKMWGRDAWQKIVVCIVADGRLKMNSRTLATLGLLGLFQVKQMVKIGWAS